MRRWLATVVSEGWSLFVDDLGLAIGAIISVLVAAAIQRSALAAVAAPLLFVGLVTSVLVSVWRRARRKD